VPDDPLAGIYHYRAVDTSLATSGQPTVAQLGSIAVDALDPQSLHIKNLDNTLTEMACALNRSSVH
jgi:hypothetical protein